MRCIALICNYVVVFILRVLSLQFKSITVCLLGLWWEIFCKVRSTNLKKKVFRLKNVLNIEYCNIRSIIKQYMNAAYWDNLYVQW